MVWHTVQEAQNLTGKSRRTLYRDMAKGRLSWVSDADNGRRLETSELIRVYGELIPLAQPESGKLAHDGTTLGTADLGLILAELKSLRNEVQELRSAMRLIEYKPADGAPEVESTALKSPWWEPFLKPFKSS